MPQSERSQIIIEFLRWLNAKGKKDRGATLKEAVHHIEVEITNMGATTKRSISYIKACERAGLIYTHGIKFRVTEDGKNWLKKKV
jgi:hypothetical protein